jgi:flavin reductase (DIM6/NTAB) family NADH-FMN oxidoreductase RutF
MTETVKGGDMAGVDSRTFRDVLGHFPTGVVIVTAVADGEPVGMVVGTFASVSLDPPLVAFLSTKTSTTYPRIREAGAFTANVVSASDEQLCRVFATQGADKFAGVEWSMSALGSPVLASAVAWIDCSIETIHGAGDHDIVVGRVSELSVGTGDGPLLFYRGGYGRFEQGFRTAPGQSDLLVPLRYVDRIRHLLEDAAEGSGAECFANVVVDDELVIIGSTGDRSYDVGISRIGQRMPLVAPLGAGAVAWLPNGEQEKWVERAGLDAIGAAAARGALARVRSRGWSCALASEELLALEAAVGRQEPEILGGERIDEQARTLARTISLSTHDPESLETDVSYHVRNVSVPVLGRDGRLLLLLSLYGLPHSLTATEIGCHVELLRTAAQQAERLLSDV